MRRLRHDGKRRNYTLVYQTYSDLIGERETTHGRIFEKKPNNNLASFCDSIELVLAVREPLRLRRGSDQFRERLILQIPQHMSVPAINSKNCDDCGPLRWHFAKKVTWWGARFRAASAARDLSSDP